MKGSNKDIMFIGGMCVLWALVVFMLCDYSDKQFNWTGAYDESSSDDNSF